jgi:hypothetical protein
MPTSDGGGRAWLIVHAGWDDYEVLAAFDDEAKAQAVPDEVDLTPTGKRRGYWQIDDYPLNPRTFTIAHADV